MRKEKQMVNKLENSLTLNYFFQQKITEISLTILIISSIIFIPYLLGHNIGDGESTSCSGDFIKMVYEDSAFTSQNYWELQKCSKTDEWGEGLLYIFALAILGFLLYWVYMLMLFWMYCNWEKAKKRAKADIRKAKKDALVATGEGGSR